MIWSYTVCKDKVYPGTAGLLLIKIMHKFLGSLSILLTQCKFLVILLLDGCFWWSSMIYTYSSILYRHVFKMEIFFLFLSENSIWWFMQTVSSVDNLYEVSKPVFWGNISKCTFTTKSKCNIIQNTHTYSNIKHHYQNNYDFITKYKIMTHI